MEKSNLTDENRKDDAVEAVIVDDTESDVTEIKKSNSKIEVAVKRKAITYSDIQEAINNNDGDTILEWVSTEQVSLITEKTANNITRLHQEVNRLSDLAREQGQDLKIVLDVASRLFNSVADLEQPLTVLLGLINSNGMPDPMAIIAAIGGGKLKPAVNNVKDGMSNVFDDKTLEQIGELGKRYPNRFQVEKLNGLINSIKDKFGK